MENAKHFGKRGTVLDSIFIMVSVVIAMIVIVFGYKLISSINTEVQTMDALTPEAKIAYDQVDTTYLRTMDYLFLFFWLASLFTALISAWYIDTHPVFFIISLLVIMVIMVGAVPLANVAESILASDELAASTAHFSIIMWFVENFFRIMLIQTFAISIVLYSKLRQPG